MLSLDEMVKRVGQKVNKAGGLQAIGYLAAVVLCFAFFGSRGKENEEGAGKSEVLFFSLVACLVQMNPFCLGSCPKV